MDWWASADDRSRRWCLTAVAAVLLGPLVGPLLGDALPPVAAAGIAALLLVAVTWSAEGTFVSRPFVAAGGFWAATSVSLLTMRLDGSVVVWELALLLLAVACSDRIELSTPAVSVAGEPASPVQDLEAPPPAATFEDVVEPDMAEGREDDPGLVQSLIRRDDGPAETVEGMIRCVGGPNHVVLHPPLPSLPTVEVFPMSDGCEATVAEVTRFGFRLTVRGEGPVAYSAAAATLSPVDASALKPSSHGSTISSSNGRLAEAMPSGSALK